MIPLFGETEDRLDEMPPADVVEGIVVPVTAIRRENQRVKDLAKTLVVKDLETFNAAVAFGQECARRIKVVEERFREVDEKTKKAKKVTDDARSAVLKLIRDLKEPFEEAMRIADRVAREWKIAEDRRLAQRAAEARAEEQNRLEAEREAKVKALEMAGDTVTAAAVAAQPVVAVVEIDQVPVPAGTSYRSHWKAILLDMPALIKAVAEGRAPISLLEFNQSEGDALARAQKEAMRVEGVVARDVGSAVHT
jgi:hypothetical protein